MQERNTVPKSLKVEVLRVGLGRSPDSGFRDEVPGCRGPPCRRPLTGRGGPGRRSRHGRPR